MVLSPRSPPRWRWAALWWAVLAAPACGDDGGAGGTDGGSSGGDSKADTGETASGPSSSSGSASESDSESASASGPVTDSDSDWDTSGDTDDPDTDTGDDAVCGDGIVSASEFCDPGIVSTRSGGCAPTCIERGACAEEVLEGDDCQQHCVLHVQTACVDDDGCCPADCDAASDSDCAALSCAEPATGGPWKQYRSTEDHVGAPLGGYEPCLPQALLSGVPTTSSIDLGGPVWQSPILRSAGGQMTVLVATGNADAAVHTVDPSDATVDVWTLPNNASRSVGFFSLTLNDHVILSSRGGLLERYRTTFPSTTYESFVTDAQEVPNAPVTFRFDNPSHWLGLLGYEMLGAITFSDPLQNFGGVGTCAPVDASGYRVAALDFRHIFLFVENEISYAVSIFDLDTEQTRRCKLLDFRLQGIPAVDDYLIYMAGEDGTLYAYGDMIDHDGAQPLWVRTPGGTLGSPTLDPFGNVYLRAGPRLVVYDRNGIEQWDYDAGAAFDNPVPLGYGIVVVADAGGRVHAVRDGVAQWTVDLAGTLTDPVVASDGRVFVGSDNGSLHTLTP